MARSTKRTCFLRFLYSNPAFPYFCKGAPHGSPPLRHRTHHLSLIHIWTAALTGDDSPNRREEIISRLTDDENVERQLDYILTVDIFNEGVDIPEINQVIMLRPTQSPVVFIQQLGRGLRKSEGKEYRCV